MVALELRTEDESELEAVKSFMTKTCQCTLEDGRPCSTRYSTEFVIEWRIDCLMLQEQSYDCFNSLLSGYFLANRRIKNKERNATWKINDQRVCSRFFAFCHACSPRKLTTVVDQVNTNGLAGWSIRYKHRNDVTRSQGVLQAIEDVKVFLTGRVLDEGIALPGRCPSHNEFRAIRFPSHYTKKQLYLEYKEACVERGDQHVIAYSTFLMHWETGCNDVGIMGSASDVCELCRANMKRLGELASMEEGEQKEMQKREEFGAILNHLECVKTERKVYNKNVDHAKDAFRANSAAPAVSMLSFDFAECKTLPHFSVQPGPLHFLSRRKVFLFGITNEGEENSTFYIYDEAENGSVGKGGDAVCSMLYHHLEHFVPPSGAVSLQCDNCSGTEQKPDCYIVPRLASFLRTNT